MVVCSNNILGVPETPAQDGAASTTPPPTSAEDPHKLAFGLATPPALFGSTDIRERNKEGEGNVYAYGAACLKSPLTVKASGGALPKLRRPKRKKISARDMAEALEEVGNDAARPLEPLVCVSIASGGARAVMDITEGVSRMSVDPAPGQPRAKRRSPESREQEEGGARDKIQRSWQRAKQEGLLTMSSIQTLTINPDVSSTPGEREGGGESEVRAEDIVGTHDQRCRRQTG